MFYESAADVIAKAPVCPRHLARPKSSAPVGPPRVGTFGEPQAEGWTAVFGSPEAAEEFVRDDRSYEGVVKTWTLREWDEVASEIQVSSDSVFVVVYPLAFPPSSLAAVVGTKYLDRSTASGRIIEVSE